MHSILNDLRHSARLLLKSPGFTSIAILVLALGIGANSAVFSIVNAMAFQPIPSDRPGIVGVYARDTTRPDSYRGFSWDAYQVVRSPRQVFDDAMAFTMTMVGVMEGEQTRRSFSAIVSASYFRTLDVRLAAGRDFTGEEERPGSDIPVVIVGHQVARKAGVTAGEMVGRTLRLNAREYTIVGVAPEGFTGTMALIAPEFWLPTGVYEHVADVAFQESSTTRELANPGNRPLMIVARLRPGLDRDSAAPLLAALSSQLVESDRASNQNFELLVQRLSRTSISTSPRTDDPTSVLSVLLMSMAGLVLLTACLNLANMLLARGTARRKEIAVRLALGSGRGRLIRQLLTENLLIAVLGGGAGLLLAVWGTRLLTATFAAVLPLVVTFDGRPDVRVLAATLVFCVIATLVAGLGPAWRATRPDVLPDLKEQPAELRSRRRFSMRNALVVGQLALSLALLAAAGLFTRGAIKAGTADPGFPLDGGAIASIDPSLGGYEEARSREAIRRIMERVRATPGVQSASMASIVPFGEFQEGRLVQQAGTPPAPDGERETGVDATYTIVGTDYFESLRIPVLRGRGFTPAEEEAPAGPSIAVVDEPLARQLFGADDPIGRRVQFARRNEAMAEPLEIVGVVAGVRHDLFDKAPVPHIYVPLGRNFRSGLNLHVRLAAPSPGAETAMLGTLRQEIRAADPGVPLLNLKTLRQHRDGSIPLWAVNAGARLFSVFGGVALLLAVIGVYGVRSYVVSRRTREIGIRMALGATRGNVVRLVLRESILLTITGLGVGLLLAWGVAQGISGLLYEVSALDPLVFAASLALLAAAALLASYIPARRASRILPITALRTE